MVFAEMSGSTFLFRAAIVIAFICYGIYCLNMMIYHPEQWQEWCRQSHEANMEAKRQKLAREQMQHERDVEKRKRNSAALGIGGAILKMFLGHRH